MKHLTCKRAEASSPPLPRPCFPVSLHAFVAQARLDFLPHGVVLIHTTQDVQHLPRGLDQRVEFDELASEVAQHGEVGQLGLFEIFLRYCQACPAIVMMKRSAAAPY